MTERRSQIRLLDSELILLGWQEAGHQGEITTLKQLGNVEDISRNGLAVVVDEAPPVNTRVTISYGENTLTGVVRYRTSREIDVLIGIEFDEASKDSSSHFQPELLVSSF